MTRWDWVSAICLGLILGVVFWGFYTIVRNGIEAEISLEGCVLTALVAKDEGHLRQIYDCGEK